MLKNDGSIDKIEEDKLNRKDFIERIIEGILGYKDTDSLVIGLEGNWGSGKTSILNIIEKELENKKINVFKFNPWNFSIRKQLVSDFFEQFSLFVGSRSNAKEALKEVSKSLMKISYILKPITTIAGVVPIVGNITKGVEELGNSYEKISNTIDLESIKKGVEKALGEGDEKIIIFIDDLDRLLDSEICEVLQFVKGIGDLKNIIYILAYDKQIVINSLDKVTSNKGEEYLKKIVQIQMELPIITSTKIGFLFKSEIENLFNEKILEMNELELEYLCRVFEEILIHLPKTVRDLKRIMNNIRFGIKVTDNLNLIDYILIKTLEVMKHNIYQKIKENKEILVVSSKINLKRSESLEFLNTFSKEDKSLMEKILKIVFEKQDEYIPTNKYLEHCIPKRISNNVYFYDYFKVGFQENSISKIVEERLMNIMKEEEFLQYLSKISDLEIVSEVILNSENYIFYLDYRKTRNLYLINLLEEYILNNQQKFDNVVILKNKLKELICDQLRNDQKLKVDILNVKTMFSLKLIWSGFSEYSTGDSKEIKEKLLLKYLRRNNDNNKSLEEYINFLREELLGEDFWYFLSKIAETENGMAMILKNKPYIEGIKDLLEDYIKGGIYEESFSKIIKYCDENN